MSSLLKSLTRSTSSALSMADYQNFFTFEGLQYQLSGATSLGSKQEEIGSNFLSYVQQAYKQNGVVFACMLVRQLLFSEARFQYRRRSSGRPGELFGNQDLAPLETPWPGATTGDLLSRAIQDADLAGNFYGLRRPKGVIRLRPDWISIVIGSREDRDVYPGDIDAEVVGYIYHPGGKQAGRPTVSLLREQVAHFAPIPDPAASFRGMSWLSPIVTEIMGDQAATTHKLKYFENGATANMVVSLDPAIKQEAFDRWVAAFENKHAGQANAYKTLYLGGGADAKVIGSDMKQVDFKTTIGSGETRIAAAAGVPPVIVGLSEGLEAATYSNYASARRRFADGTMRPLWRNMAGSLANIVPIPTGAELWYDDRDIPFLQEDVKDAADILKVDADAIKALTEAGYDPKSVIDAVTAGDLSRLQHTGVFSVQLQPPGSQPALTGQNGRRLLEQFVTSQQ